MKDLRATEIRVGIFVIAGLVIAAWIIATLGKEARIFVDQYNLYASFSDVAGLREGAPVRLAGIDVGLVHSITLPEPLNIKKVIVNMKIGREFKTRIRGDSIATIETQGVLGDKYISITFGNPEERVLENGDHILTENPKSVIEFVSKGNEIMDSTLSIFRKVDEILSGTEGEETKRSLADTMTSIKRIVEEIEKGKGLLHSLIYDSSRVELLTQSIRNIESLTMELTSLLVEIREGDGNLHQMVYGTGFRTLVEDILKLSDSIEGIVKNIREEEEGLLHTLIYSRGEENILKNLTEASRSFKEFARRIEKGEGSLGAIINDPTLYRDLKSLLGRAERSRILKGYIKKALEDEKGEN